jgi:hypothetical protein
MYATLADTVFRWQTAAIVVSASILLLEAAGGCVIQVAPWAGWQPVRASEQAGPPLQEHTVAKKQFGFASSRPAFQGATDLCESAGIALPNPQAELVRTIAWFPAQAAQVQRHRGRAPPCS